MQQLRAPTCIPQHSPQDSTGSPRAKCLPTSPNWKSPKLTWLTSCQLCRGLSNTLESTEEKLPRKSTCCCSSSLFTKPFKYLKGPEASLDSLKLHYQTTHAHKWHPQSFLRNIHKQHKWEAGKIRTEENTVTRMFAKLGNFHRKRN